MTTNNKRMSRKTGIAMGVCAAAAVAIAAFAGAHGAIPVPGMDQTVQRGAQLTPMPVAFQPPAGAPVSFADIFEQVSPAVVSIDVQAEVAIGQTLQIPGLPFRFEAPEGAPETRRASAAGSGFFISPDGYIVTNNHVVEDASEIKVTLKDERVLDAVVVGTDPDTDLAVLKVEGNNFPFVNFENAANPRVGDWVIAIGNPFGLGGTATVGIISAEGRRTPDETSTFVDFLQIDAAINSGNSGGPTFDVYGRVIGVNSQILSPSGGSVGIGFAIPAKVAENVTRQLIEEGRVTRGYLGARVGPYTEMIAEGLGLDFPAGGGGAYISSVTPGGPADRAGVENGDVVLSLNGNPMKDSTELTRAVANTRAGDTLSLEVLRVTDYGETETRTINVRSGTRPSMAALLSGEDEASPADRGRGRGRGPDVEEPVKLPSVLGMSLGPVDRSARQRFRVPDEITGAIVESTTRGEPGEVLSRGDVITRAAGVPVRGPDDVIAAVEAQRRNSRDSILMLVRRAQNGEIQPMLIELPESEIEEG